MDRNAAKAPVKSEFNPFDWEGMNWIPVRYSRRAVFEQVVNN